MTDLALDLILEVLTCLNVMNNDSNANQWENKCVRLTISGICISMIPILANVLLVQFLMVWELYLSFMKLQRQNNCREGRIFFFFLTNRTFLFQCMALLCN